MFSRLPVTASRKQENEKYPVDTASSNEHHRLKNKETLTTILIENVTPHPSICIHRHMIR